MGRLSTNIVERKTEAQLVRKVLLDSLQSQTCGESESELGFILASAQQKICSWATCLESPCPTSLASDLPFLWVR